MFYFTRITLVKSLKVYFLVTIQRIIIIDYTAYSGAYSGGGAVRGAPLPERFWGGGRQKLKRKSTVTHHSNRNRDKEEEKEEIYRFGSYDGQRKLLFPPSYISLSPFLPFFIRNRKQNAIFSNTYSTIV